MRARKPLRGARVFRVKFFLRRCATGRGYLLARPSCSCTLIQKDRTTGCRVNVISCCVFVPCPLGLTSMPIRDTLVVNPFLEISCRAVISKKGKGRLYRLIRRTNFPNRNVFITFLFRVENCSRREIASKRRLMKNKNCLYYRNFLYLRKLPYSTGETWRDRFMIYSMGLHGHGSHNHH